MAGLIESTHEHQHIVGFQVVKDIEIRSRIRTFVNNDRWSLVSKNKTTSLNGKNKNNEVLDICTIVEKCSIDEISKYLLNKGKKKGFPNLTKRQ